MKKFTFLFFTLFSINSLTLADNNTSRLKVLTLSFPNNTKTVCFILSYDNIGNITKMIESNNCNDPVTKYIFEYSTNSYKITSFNSKDNIIYYYEYSHDEKGNILNINKYSNSDKLTEITKFYYKNGKLHYVDVLDSENVLTEKRYFYYMNNYLKTVEMLHPNGDIKNILIFEYSSIGDKISMMNYNKSNNLIFKASYEYENGLLTNKSINYLLY